MGAVVEDAVARGAEQPQGQFLCEYQGTELQTLLLSHVGTQGHSHGPGVHSPCWGALRVPLILVFFYSPDTLQASPKEQLCFGDHRSTESISLKKTSVIIESNR